MKNVMLQESTCTTQIRTNDSGSHKIGHKRVMHFFHPKSDTKINTRNVSKLTPEKNVSLNYESIMMHSEFLRI